MAFYATVIGTPNSGKSFFMTKMLNFATNHSANTTLIGKSSFMIEIEN